jgi:hypothetical protein
LLVASNYSAYYNIAKSYVFADQAEQTTRGLINSVEAANIKDKYVEENEETKLEEQTTDKNNLSVRSMKKKQDKESIPFDIEITPYENRIIIPKI